MLLIMYHSVMTIFATPTLDDTELEVISMIDDLRTRMRHRVGDDTLRRWNGGLRRMLEARAIQGSNTIEGYDASLDDVLAVMDGEQPLDADTETRMALQGYQEAMTYALQASQDDSPFVDEGLLKAWHFMMLKHDLNKLPGRWRHGPIYVYDEERDEQVYEGPPHELVPHLIEEMVDQLEDWYDEHEPSVPVLVRAAMAHLNLVMIHPFKDGNGRMARCLQTYVLAREKILAPVFSSIEEYLGTKANTRAYYAVLAEVGLGSWHPEQDARPWVRFCLTAHFRQARTVLRRIERTEQLWVAVAEMAQKRRLPERCIGPLCEAATGRRVRRASYLANVEVTYGETIPNLTASRDLKNLVTAGLFEPIGDKRGRYYLATPELKEAWSRVREASEGSGAEEDPFSLVQLRLDIPA
jgi:Fic family protein